MMATKWHGPIIFALFCSPALASTGDPWCSPAKEPHAYSFAWQPDRNASSGPGSVRVSNAAGRTVQILANVEHDAGSQAPSKIHDYNNDGCDDLAIVSDVAAIGNESKTVFLYDRQRKRFVRSNILSEIGGLELDPRHRNCVTGFWKGGAMDFSTSRHCWKNGKLLIEKAYEVSAVGDEDGKHRCYLHVNTTYRGGKKRVTKRCTQAL